MLIVTYRSAPPPIIRAHLCDPLRGRTSIQRCPQRRIASRWFKRGRLGDPSLRHRDAASHSERVRVRWPLRASHREGAEKNADFDC